MSFCDASGLAVLVGTGRRARLLGGVLCLAAPSPAVVSALRLVGLLRQFDIFPTVLAATGQPHTVKRVPCASTRASASGAAFSGGRAARTPLTPAPGPPATRDLREAVTALLAHADAWRDADPERRCTSPLRALARAQVRNDRAALAKAARFLLVTLARYPLSYSPAVATTASDLRHLIAPISGLPGLS